MTACVSSDVTSPNGSFVKFDDVRTTVGVKNITSFFKSGQFTCEVEGLYLISAFIDTSTNYGHYHIYKNEMIFVSNFFNFITTSGDIGGSGNTGTAVVAVALDIGDTVRIQTANSMYVVSDKRSCITIAKLN